MKISEIIIRWYKKYKRDLPWRKSREPYKVWLSEIILQQTRVQQGLSYYNRFINEFPDIYMLAEADDDRVMKIWQGLGYYSRARNLIHAARQVVNEYDGIFPSSSRELMKLKGVGPYTAAAVASIVFNEPVPVVDGNVSRVLSRLYAISKPVNRPDGMKEISAVAEKLLNRKDPGEYNQAIMEFGALQCIPVNPDCFHCPLKDYCEAFSKGMVANFPVKVKNKPTMRRYFLYLLMEHNGTVYIRQRNNDDIWKKMYEFPLIETEVHVSPEYIGEKVSGYLSLANKDFIIEHISKEVKHQLTHRTILARFIHIKLNGMESRAFDESWIRVSWEELEKYPVPRLIDRYLEQLH